ncbi:MAG: hypothetical protein AAFY69_01705 [Pseudomonadota bacterium]
MSIEFAIEWAYGDFHIARLKGGEVEASWKSPTPVTDLSELQAAMTAAAGVVELGRGGSVAIAYEDDLHTHEFLELPSMSRRDRIRFLQRYVDNNKPFDSRAAWRAHPVKRNKINGALLHLMPHSIIDALMRVCSDFYLVPKLMVPLTEIMSRFVPMLESEQDGAHLLIALFDSRTQMLIANEAGEILFVRELSYPWTAETHGRLVVDINRTIGYAKQRIGGGINQAWVLGTEAEAVCQSLAGRIDASVRFDKRSVEREFWMRQVAVLPLSLHSNFIPRLARRSITGKTMVRAGLLMTGVVIAATLGVVGAVEGAIWRDRTDVVELMQRIEERREQIEVLENDVARMDAEARKLDILNLDAFNLPGLFLSQLSDIVPEGLVVTEVRIGKAERGWDLAIRGHSTVSLGDIAPLLSSLEARLSGPPWNGNIVRSWEAAWMQQLEQGMAAGRGDVGFEIEGQFR